MVVECVVWWRIILTSFAHEPPHRDMGPVVESLASVFHSHASPTIRALLFLCPRWTLSLHWPPWSRRLRWVGVGGGWMCVDRAVMVDELMLIAHTHNTTTQHNTKQALAPRGRCECRFRWRFRERCQGGGGVCGERGAGGGALGGGARAGDVVARLAGDVARGNRGLARRGQGDAADGGGERAGGTVGGGLGSWGEGCSNLVD